MVFIMTSVVCIRILNARTGVSIRQAPQFRPPVPSVPSGTSQQAWRLLSMDAMTDTGNLRQARAIVSEKLRAYFAEIKAGLDADSEDFFKRVMQQADQRQHAGLR